MKINIVRVAKPSHLAKLLRIGRKTFRESFAASNTKKNIKEYIKVAFTEEKIEAELANPNSQFYFARSKGKIIGYLKVNMGDAQTELKQESGLEIERIYVLSTFHGMGVGQALFDKALKIAKENKSAYMWLGVWEENRKAISFYEKNGFTAFGSHIFQLGDEAQTDILMKLSFSV
ncbi:GNAT family N-acetyltransferase [Cytophagales bacterium LB-30]|uniref:GNAT family N-acetyltransferase n=1 Tax=Shiella aurantiaca TaxID=3058365 RepID=A0ABT8F7Y4_9BACT|nr:GNAT family N-acetyltransferase [Shiella aurantiaca]MDN4166547.1 GNAT family N-acetyltransferase [Shiella aurantiaca]